MKAPSLNTSRNPHCLPFFSRFSTPTSAPGCTAFRSQPLHLLLLLHPPRLMPTDGTHTSMLFINDVKPLFLSPSTPHPLLFTPISLLWSEETGLWGDKSLLEEGRGKKKKSVIPLTLLSSEEESLSPPGRIGSQSAHTHTHTRALTYTIICRSLTFTHTHALTHGHARSPSRTHSDEEGWLSSERTLQAAACLGKPDAFLPPGRSTHCHLKGSLLGLIHRRLRGRVLVGVAVPDPGDTG